MQLDPLYPLVHPVLKQMFPDCLWSGSRTARTIALTFDDGPHPQHTPQLLEVLNHYGIRASFFWLGLSVQNAPEAARRVWEAGHWIGLHGFDHRPFPLLSSEALQSTLAQTQRAIAQACHVPLEYVQQNVRDVRPPYGVFTPQTLRSLRQWKYRPVMWSVVPEDWVQPGIQIAAQRILNRTCNGSLIVLHDGQAGGADVAETAAAIIPQLLEQGYHFGTIDDLWQQ